MAQATVLNIRRYFTKEGSDPYDMFKWVTRDSKIDNPVTGKIAFEQKSVEFPDTWSMNAINIVSQKYFCGTPGTKDREASLKTLIDRVADTVTRHGEQEDYFASHEQAEIYNAELKYILASQRAAFNSPVWFNIGAASRSQQASACFILAVEDTMPSILNWYAEEGMIFKGGSGSGVNVSTIRSSVESLGQSGGKASGPLSFMRGADSSAGAIKSGGKTRRAAKMVIMNIDHPDVEEFIWCKAIEERKARVLQEAGFDMSLDGTDIFSVQYQNANNSVRVTDEFMQSVENDDDWQLVGVKDKKVYKTIKARDLWRQIAESAWECADPGLQFDTTANNWHTTPNAGRINGSNPCSEYMHLDNSACNLASINLLKYLNEDGSFDVEAFKQTVEIVFTAQEILVGYSEYPTPSITKNAKAYRELGMGYANLGALLMAQGLPYDSDEGRAQAAAITALMTGHAYATSARIAKQVGTFSGFNKDREGVMKVLSQHRDAVRSIDARLVAEELLSSAAEAWDEAVELGDRYGVRNSQATVLAPTGTIGFMMDCDTTGVEPDFSLTKYKKLVGGGNMVIVNQTVPRALSTMGYNSGQIKDIEDYIHERSTVVGAPHLKKEHYDTFACAVGENAIHYMGHVKMMGAVQPFISGAISKTVNMPEQSTVEDIEELHLVSWKLGIKAVAIYRDGSKVAQPMSDKKDKTDSEEKLDAHVAQSAEHVTEQLVAMQPHLRRELPRTRQAKTFAFRVADSKGFVTVGEYDDGTPGELFLQIAKQGSTLGGIMDAFAISVSHGLQYGVPLKSYVKAFINTSFAPAGVTDDTEIKMASSLVDYIFRRLAKTYLSIDDQLELGLVSLDDIEAEAMDNQASLLEEKVVSAKPTQPTISTEINLPIDSAKKQDDSISTDRTTISSSETAPLCYSCGNITQRAGSCYVCTSCGTTSGCS
jgi:ribonucleoside-diphosphate reductase alpha chain